MPDKATIYGLCAFAVVAGIITMSVSSAELNKITDAKKKKESPIIAGVVIGGILIVIGILVAGWMFFQKSDATAMVGTAPGAAAGSATAANANPITAIKHAALNSSHALANEAKVKEKMANAASELNALMKENGA